METYKEEIMIELTKETTTSFEQLDEILYDILPRDLVREIYSFGTGICVECEKCCSICKFYCSLGCLRDNNRDVCCKWELTNEIRKVETNKIVKLQEEKEQDKEEEKPKED